MSDVKATMHKVPSLTSMHEDEPNATGSGGMGRCQKLKAAASERWDPLSPNAKKAIKVALVVLALLIAGGITAGVYHEDTSKFFLETCNFKEVPDFFDKMGAGMKDIWYTSDTAALNWAVTGLSILTLALAGGLIHMKLKNRAEDVPNGSDADSMRVHTEPYADE